MRHELLALGLVALSSTRPALAREPEPKARTTSASTATVAPVPEMAAAPHLEVAALVQADWIVMRQSSLNAVDSSTGAPLNDDRFLLRRGRVRATLSRGFVAGWLELDANTVDAPTVRPF